MPEEKIPLILLSLQQMSWLGRRMRGLGRILLLVNPNLSAVLPKLKIDVESSSYAVASLFSSLIYGSVFFLLAYAAIYYRGEIVEPALPALAIGICIWSVFFLLHMIYPGIIVKKVAAKESNDLLFALREMMVDIDGGVPLYDSMKNVAAGEYGYVSRDLEGVVRDIERGVPDRVALRELALRTESEYMKRALWQMVNALESGASLSSALAGIVQSIESYIYRDIKNYSSNLNLLMLLYMLGATVIPSLGITFLVLLSAFSGLGVTFTTLIMLLMSSVLLQLVMIGYMSSTRPEIFGG